MGPKRTSTQPKVTNLINSMMIALNIVTISYAMSGMWTWLVSINIAFGCIT